MSVFDYKNSTNNESKNLYNDAMALTQYKISGSWAPINANQLGYQGPVDLQGIFTGRGAAATADALVLGKYEDGDLVGIGISFRGSGVGGTTEDMVGDFMSNALTAISENYAKDYIKHAFDDLLGDIARYAQSQGLSSNQVLVTGHSQGGAGVNSLAVLSADNWGGFYKNSNYVAFASPTQSPGAQVLNIGYENDPVFRVLDGTTLNYTTSLGIHDKPQLSATNNIVNFNDQYVSQQDNAWMGSFGLVVGSAATGLARIIPGLLGDITKATSTLFGQQSITNLDSWKAHLIEGYADGFNRLVDSEFYNLTHRDSTVIVSNLSEGIRANTWVEDLNRYAEKHSGSTFIIGTNSYDKLQGGKGNDYLDGLAGDDVFRDDGGYNFLQGGSGHDIFQLKESLSNYKFASDGEGSLYITDAYGGISITQNLEAVMARTPLVPKESGKFDFEGFYKSIQSDFSTENSDNTTYQVTPKGLLHGSNLESYSVSHIGNAYSNKLQTEASGGWLFGQAGDDKLLGNKGDDYFVGGVGNDYMESGGGRDTFLFHEGFGTDIIKGFAADDKLIFQGTGGGKSINDIHSYTSTDHGDTLFSFGADTVRLVGVGLDQISSGNVIIC